MNYEIMLTKLPVLKIREIVKRLNLPVAGKKADLIVFLSTLLNEKDSHQEVLAVIQDVYMESVAPNCLNGNNTSAMDDSVVCMNGDGWPVGHPFFNTLDTVVGPTCLPQGINRANFTITYKLSSQHTKRLDPRRNLLGQMVQVQLRFCYVDEAGQATEKFPDNMDMLINRRIVALPPPIPTPNPQQVKRRYYPLNITGYTKSSTPNVLQIDYRSEGPGNFVIGIYLAEQLSTIQLIGQLRERPVRPADQTRRLIMEKLKEDEDVITTMLKVSLSCPLSRKRLKIPCRSSECRHFPCFDAEVYIQMNECRPTWICPICNQSAKFESLIIDGYFLEILNSALLSAADEEIELQRDGTWSLSKTAVDENVELVLQSSVLEISGNGNEAASDETVILISDDEDDGGHAAEPSILLIPSSSQSSSSSSLDDSTAPDVFDRLFQTQNASKVENHVDGEKTAEDDDEEQPIARRLRRHCKRSLSSNTGIRTTPTKKRK